MVPNTLRFSIVGNVEHRRAQRFPMQLPLAVTQLGAEWTPLSGRTQNISSAGVLFTTEQERELGDLIEYVITLPTAARHRVTIRCNGKVVRCEKTEQDPGPYQVAATLDRWEFVRSD